MKIEKAISILKADLECNKNCISAVPKCNNDCDNCDICYANGTNGEHMQALEIAITLLELLCVTAHKGRADGQQRTTADGI